MNEFPKRKHPRLKEYDYGENGAYFVTICTEGRKPILSHIAEGRVETLKDLLALSAKPPQVRLTKIGSIVEMYIRGMTPHTKMFRWTNMLSCQTICTC